MPDNDPDYDALKEVFRKVVGFIILIWLFVFWLAFKKTFLKEDKSKKKKRENQQKRNSLDQNNQGRESINRDTRSTLLEELDVNE